MQVTATEAKNRFGTLCAHAKKSPVMVLKGGRPDTVIMSYGDYQSLKSPDQKTQSQRIKEFQETYKEWFAWENEAFEKNGHWIHVEWRDGA